MNTSRISIIVLATVVSAVALWATRNRSSPATTHTEVKNEQIVLAEREKEQRPLVAEPAPIAAKKPAQKVRAKGPVGPHRLPSQHFILNGQRDTVFRTAGGCTVHVPANAMVTTDGRAVEGRIELELKEALRPIDFVMGNLCTTYKGRPLESGGTFFLAARSGNEELVIAPGHAIDLIVPTFGVKSGMKLFPGDRIGEEVVWNEPGPLALAQPMAQVEVQQEAVFALEADTLLTNVTYRVEGFDRPYDAPQQVTDKVAEIAWANGGLWLKRDSTFAVGKYTVHFLANDEPSVTAVVPQWQGADRKGVQVVPRGQAEGWNPHTTDTRLNYVFSVAQLGWANIDRLLNDKRTRPVDIITRVDNADDKENLRITLVMKSHNLYIPGYRMKDGTYAFSHSDQEKMLLPIGAKAVVVATAGTGSGTVFAMQPIVVEREGRIDLHLTPTTETELKEAILAAL